MKKNFKRSQKGFTLIELLVVVGILAVLLTITLVAVNPARNFQQTNNVKRQADVNAILGAVSQYIADNKGGLPPTVVAGTTDMAIGSAIGGTLPAFCTAIVQKYIAAFPVDPKAVGVGYVDCNSYATGYTISVSTPAANDTPRITIKAPLAELTQTISVTR